MFYLSVDTCERMDVSEQFTMFKRLFWLITMPIIKFESQNMQAAKAARHDPRLHVKA